MKANEAPEKIYILNHTDYSDRRILNAFTEKENNNDIVYIRKDALIEKACDAYCKVCGHYAHKTPTYICRQTCEYFKDFKKYIEGE